MLQAAPLALRCAAVRGARADVSKHAASRGVESGATPPEDPKMASPCILVLLLSPLCVFEFADESALFPITNGRCGGGSRVLGVPPKGRTSHVRKKQFKNRRQTVRIVEEFGYSLQHKVPS